MTCDEARARLKALGLTAAAVEVLLNHFVDADRRGKPGHGLSRVSWLEGQSFDPGALPVKCSSSDGIDRWDGGGALGYLILSAVCDDLLVEGVDGARLVVASPCFPTGTLGYWVRRLAAGGYVALAHRDLAATAACACGRRTVDGHEPARDCDPVQPRGTARRRRVDGGRHPRRRAGGSRPPGGARAVRRASRSQGIRPGGRARAARLCARRPTTMRRCSSSHGLSTTRCPRSAPSPWTCASPATRSFCPGSAGRLGEAFVVANSVQVTVVAR